MAAQFEAVGTAAAINTAATAYSTTAALSGNDLSQWTDVTDDIAAGLIRVAASAPGATTFRAMARTFNSNSCTRVDLLVEAVHLDANNNIASNYPVP